MLQILDPAGELVGPLPDLTEDELVEIYRTLITTRLTDEKLLNLQRQGRLAAYYQVSGQEAQCGAAAALGDDDWVFTAYRELGVWIARGLPPEAYLGLWKGVPDDADAWDVRRHRVTRLNATIGTHLPHAVGFAYSNQLQNNGEVTMAIFGDGATSENDFHAAMNFAGVWKAPTIFLCQNNGVAQSTTVDRQTAASTLAQKADAYGFPGVRVDGMDPLAMYTAVSEAATRARAGDGPTFIEMVTYRFSPHSTYDGTPGYRTREEESSWKEKDPIVRTRTFLEAKGLWSADQEDEIRSEISTTLERVIGELEVRAPVDRGYSPRFLYDRLPKLLVDQLHAEQDDLGEPRIEFAPEEVWDVGDDPVPTGPTETMDYTTALNRTLTDAFETDDSLVVLGEDVALEGGVFRITEGMLDRFGEGRVIDTPLCETGIVGTAVGMAMAGQRPVAEIEFAGFVYPAFDQVIGHMARMRWRYRGEFTSPIVLRMPVGTDIDSYEFHCDTPEAYFTHAPGLVVVYPSSPYDAAGLMRTALESPDPVVFFEPIPLYRGLSESVPTDPYRIPFGKARTLRTGTDVTVVVYGYATRAAIDAAEQLAESGVSVDLIDLRTLYPWDVDAVVESVERTGRLVTVHEAQLSAGLGAEIAATVSERAAYSLEAPPVRVGHADLFWGPTQLEPMSRISVERIIGGVRRALRG